MIQTVRNDAHATREVEGCFYISSRSLVGDEGEKEIKEKKKKGLKKKRKERRRGKSLHVI